MPDRSPAVTSFVKRYGLEKGRELCFQWELRMLREDESFRVLTLRDGCSGWQEADEEEILDTLDAIYDSCTCDECQANETALDHIAREYVLLPVTDFKVDEVAKP